MLEIHALCQEEALSKPTCFIRCLILSGFIVLPREKTAFSEFRKGCFENLGCYLKSLKLRSVFFLFLFGFFQHTDVFHINPRFIQGGTEFGADDLDFISRIQIHDFGTLLAGEEEFHFGHGDGVIGHIGP